jgi:hypothetical protein
MTSQTQNPEMDERVRQAYMLAAEMMRDGRSHTSIIEKITGLGFSSAQAETLITKLEEGASKAKSTSTAKAASPPLRMNDPLREVHNVILQMKRETRSRHIILGRIVEMGYSSTEAEVILSNFENAGNEAKQRIAKINIAVGGTICVIALVITASNFASSRSLGSDFALYSSLLFFGVMRLLRGLSRLNS